MLPLGAVGYELILSDRLRWSIFSGNAKADPLVIQFGETMRLGPADAYDSFSQTDLKVRKEGAANPLLQTGRRRLLILVNEEPSQDFQPILYPSTPLKDDGLTVCSLHPYDQDERFIHLVQLSLVIASDIQSYGGVLLHGALAEWEGQGVVLAAPGGTGKTTASNRLPLPWKSLSDDLTLVVQDSQKTYWAHPWPTWSRFLWEGGGGRWDVQQAVPLRGIFFLARAADDRVEPLGAGRGVGLLIDSARQASQLMTRGLSPEETRALHLEWFHNLSSLSQAIPTYFLHIGLTGSFWQVIERVLV